MTIEYIKSTTSTNDLINQRDANLHIIWSDEQTAGRGQRGNSWESESGANLTFSIMTQPLFLRADQQFMLSKLISNTIITTLASYKIPATIKWPNDIYVGDKKICGILIECSVSGNGALNKVVIGVGLNVNQKQFVSDAPNPTSMSIIKDCTFDREELITKIAQQFEMGYAMLGERLYSTIDRTYLNNLYRKDGVHAYSDEGGKFRASIEGITNYGALLLKRENGDIKEYQFKEVSFIL